MSILTKILTLLSLSISTTAISPGLMGYLIDHNISIESQIITFGVYMILITILVVIKRSKEA